MPSKRIFFKNAQGIRLAGIVDFPVNNPTAFALFSHCFTCTKDLKAIVKISRGLAREGIAVLRFDFTGLGDSQGDFSYTNFETNLADVQAAAQWLSREHEPPKLLIGHSLGGAAMMASASIIDSALGLVTLAAPSCTKHLAEFLSEQNPELVLTGEGQVSIGGKTYTMRSQLIESLRNRDLHAAIKSIRLPHLILHSPLDETLAFRHAEEIFQLSNGPKSFVTLDGSDHLLVNQAGDVEFVANLITVWSYRFL
jgi:alpha/beta superfamily hydrolase